GYSASVSLRGCRLFAIVWLFSFPTLASSQIVSSPRRQSPAADVIRLLDANSNRRRLLATTEADANAAESQGCVFIANAGNLRSLSCPARLAASADLNLSEDLQGGGSGSNENVRTKANLVHSSNLTGTGMTIAVLDTGYDYRHPELQSSY